MFVLYDEIPSNGSLISESSGEEFITKKVFGWLMEIVNRRMMIFCRLYIVLKILLANNKKVQIFPNKHN